MAIEKDRLVQRLEVLGQIGVYLELHIEQGAVVESRGIPIGVVDAIAGPLFLTVTIYGRADHAGAIPMGELRRDALAGAAEAVLAAETVASATSPSCVATAGRIEAICRRRQLSFEVDEHQRTAPVTTSPVVTDAVSAACAQLGLRAFPMPSGVAHDAQVLTRLADVGMIFLRCRAGISHAPDEYVAPDDVLLGAQVMYQATRQLDE